MPATEQAQQALSSGGTKNAALKAAAAAAATGAATYAVRRAMTHDDSDSNGDRERGGDSERSSKGSSSILASAAQSGWEAASEALIPMAEDAAEAAGKYLALHGPDIVREKIVPKFIEAFNDAS